MATTAPVQDKTELTWHQSSLSTGDAPSKRSGHTFTVLGTNAYLIGGCDSAEPAGPSNEVFMLKMAGNFEWEELSVLPAEGEMFEEKLEAHNMLGMDESKESSKSVATISPLLDRNDNRPGVPIPRWGHSANVYDKKFLVIFGGFHSSTNRLNDVWILDTITQSWIKPMAQQSTFTPMGNHVPTKQSWPGCPTPRGGHSANIIGSKLWVFGGYGGTGYARRDFNDVCALDLATSEWLRVPGIKGTPPRPRSGHSASVVQDKIYIFGGWSATQQFGDLHILDTVNLTWETIETHVEPRWNHTACAVEAIPNYKIFIFGGCTGNLTESKRVQGTYTNSVLVLDSGSGAFDTPKIAGEIPHVRSDTELAYDPKGSRLVTFGGWANRWFDDLFTLDVGCVVGPPYAIMGMHPASGPITGEQDVLIQGIDFVNDPRDPRIKIRFITKMGVFDVPGHFVDKETIKLKTPNLIKLLDVAAAGAGATKSAAAKLQQQHNSIALMGECAVDVRISFRDDSFTTTSVQYTFFQVTNAARCLAFGPGILGGCAGSETVFVINANDSAGDIRSSGGDDFSVIVKHDDGTCMVTDVGIMDRADGTYSVTFTPPSSGTYTIEAQFDGTFEDDSGKSYHTGGAGHIRGSPFSVTYEDGVSRELNKMEGSLVMDDLEQNLQAVRKFVTSARTELEKAIDPNNAELLSKDVRALLAVKEKLFQIEAEAGNMELRLDTMTITGQYLAKARGMNIDKKLKQFDNLRKEWEALAVGANNIVDLAKKAIKPHVHTHGAKTREQVLEFEATMSTYASEFAEGSKLPFYKWATGATGAIEALAAAVKRHDDTNKQADETKRLAHMFEFPELCMHIDVHLNYVSEQIENMKTLWDVANEALSFFEESKAMLWKEVEPIDLEDEARRKSKAVKGLIRGVRWCDAYIGLESEVNNFLTTCPLISQLGSPAMRSRHWTALKEIVKKDFTSPDTNEKLRLSEVLSLNLHEHARSVEEIAEKAAGEQRIELTLGKLAAAWLPSEDGSTKGVVFMEEQADCGVDTVTLLRVSEEDLDLLEDAQLTVQNMMSATAINSFFMNECVDSKGVKQRGIAYWNQALSNLSQVSTLLQDIQRTWRYLQPLFIQSEEVKKSLPKDAERFVNIDGKVRKIISDAKKTQNAVSACNASGLVSQMEGIRNDMETCEKALSDYLDSKRAMFPRFYFISEAHLLDILSNSSHPSKVMAHVNKLFLGTKEMEVAEATNGLKPRAITWKSFVGQENVNFVEPVSLGGSVEEYLRDIHAAMQQTVLDNFEKSLNRFATQPRLDWLLTKSATSMEATDLSQVTQLVATVSFVSEVEAVFGAMASGNRNAMAEYFAKQTQQLQNVVDVMTKNMTLSDRQRAMNVATMDVHNCDVIQNLIKQTVKDPADFQWQVQLKPRVYDTTGANPPTLEIFDASFEYGLEYIGNGSRLVMTPQTDKFILTATQALHRHMGCAPTGPASTGKTELTKELAVSLGTCCYVVNCAPEMDVKVMATMFKGLASSGAWACFDDMHRLGAHVLSACALQLQQICIGLRAKHDTVTIDGAEVGLKLTCSAFVTLNPSSSASRVSLPENLRTLFRPIAMLSPNTQVICEALLKAEGFKQARVLAQGIQRIYSEMSQLVPATEHAYDWDMRALKKVVISAGLLKRESPTEDEEKLVVKAIRASNAPRLTTDAHTSIFNKLVVDIFPTHGNVEVPGDSKMRNALKDACSSADLWPEEGFITKAMQLDELLQTNHCVFITGPPGSGKSKCWQTLKFARQHTVAKTISVDVNPKTQDTSAFFGSITSETREWKDGLLPKILLDLSAQKVEDAAQKWVVLDGDVDCGWADSMNTLMDDSKVLTLASNERVLLDDNMRLIFETCDLKHASPATTSRGGVLYLSNEDGHQTQSLIAAWVQQLECVEATKETFAKLFEKYVSPTLEKIRSDFVPLLPSQDTNLVSSLLLMLDTILTDDVLHGKESENDQEGDSSNNTGPKLNIAKAIESAMVFSAVWAFGSIFADQVRGQEHRKAFSDWWRAEFKTVKFPARETVFDYFYDIGNDKMELWKNSPYCYTRTFDSTKQQVMDVTVSTPETAAILFWMDRVVTMDKSMLLVGPTGCGKTSIAQMLIRSFNKEETACTTINMNAFTTAGNLQATIESKLEKRGAHSLGPAPGSRKLVFFLDDINLPEPDEYGTQNATELIRQHMDYGHIYDRQKQIAKNVVDVQFLSCMTWTPVQRNRLSGRLQRHFVTFAVGSPSSSVLLGIFQTYLDSHMTHFTDSVKAVSTNVCSAAVALHSDVRNRFHTSSVNFQYDFNLRHLCSVFQGILTGQPSEFNDAAKFATLWLHESERVYGDQMATTIDLDRYKELAASQAKRRFTSLNMTKYFAGEDSEPLLICHLVADESKEEQVQTTGQRTYDLALGMASVHAALSMNLKEYNLINAEMNLELFNDALLHVCRIARVLQRPAGHAFLVGAHGLGKKSLAQLAAFACGINVVQLSMSPSYGLPDFKDDLKSMFHTSGVVGDSIAFLLTDSDIVNERFLVYVSDLLLSGQVPDLYSSEDLDAIAQGLQQKVKAAGISSDRASCLRYFYKQIRHNLHVILCMSPHGDQLRTQAQRFPALVACTTIDWFHAWPQDAMLSIAKTFLKDVEFGSQEAREGVEKYMPHVFNSVIKVAQVYESAEQQTVHIGPKAYLESLKQFVKLLEHNRLMHATKATRLETGVAKLRLTANVLSTLENALQDMLHVAEERKVVVETLVETVAREAEIVATENAKVEEEKTICDEIELEVRELSEDAQKDLDAAEPLVRAALECLETLNKRDIGECRAMAAPPKIVEDVFKAVMVLLAGYVPTIVTTKTGKVKNLSFDGAKKEMMQNANDFLTKLKEFKDEVDAFRVPKINWKEVRTFLSLEHFNPEAVERKNKAAGGICAWVRNIVTYYDTIAGVKPKREVLAEAQERLDQATEQMNDVKQTADVLTAKLNAIKSELEEAIEMKTAAMEMATTSQLRRDLAKRLVAALATENETWGRETELHDDKERFLLGDTLLASSFLSYAGVFTDQYREHLIGTIFVPLIKTAAAGEPIPFTLSVNSTTLVASPAQTAHWATHGLAGDAGSVQNAAIMLCTDRWPLLIDPQLQAIAWVESTEDERRKQRVATNPSDADASEVDSTGADNLPFKILHADDHDLIKIMTASIERGDVCVITDIEESVDAALWPLIQRRTVQRGDKKMIRVGAKEVNYNDEFRLYLHTKRTSPNIPVNMQDECTIVNFSISQHALEEKLATLIMRKERPDVGEQYVRLCLQKNRGIHRRTQLNDIILLLLADFPGEVTENEPLIAELEKNKKELVKVETEQEARAETFTIMKNIFEAYKSVNERGALLFNVLQRMSRLQTRYAFSLNSFTVLVLRAIDMVTDKQQGKPGGGGDGDGGASTSIVARLKAAAKKVFVTQRYDWTCDLLRAVGMPTDGADAENLANKPRDVIESESAPQEEIQARCEVLERSITSVVYNSVRRGLNENDKLSLAHELCMTILVHRGDLPPESLSAFVELPSSSEPGGMGALGEWMQPEVWAQIKGLEQVMGLEQLGDDVMSDSQMWSDWCAHETPEQGPMPGEYAELDSFCQLLILRVLRPDRVSNQVWSFVTEKLGLEFTNEAPFEMESTFEETSAAAPMMFVLSRGADPTPFVMELGAHMAFTSEKGKFTNICVRGQTKGDDEDLFQKLHEHAMNGGWVMLQNIHLMSSKQLSRLTNLLEEYARTAHVDFRCFLTTQFEQGKENLPEALLQECIKISFAASTTLRSNMLASWAKLSSIHEDRLGGKRSDFPPCLFALAFAHSVLLARRKYGSIGWNSNSAYVFTDGDMNAAAELLHSQISDDGRVPWAHIRSAFEQVVYGARVSDMWDRRVIREIMAGVFNPNLLIKGAKLFGLEQFPMPPRNSDSKAYVQHIEVCLKLETTELFAMDRQADVDTNMRNQQRLCESIVVLGKSQAHALAQVASAKNSAAALAAATIADQTKRSEIQGYMTSLPNEFVMSDLIERANLGMVGSEGPYLEVMLQECARMNKLLQVVRFSLQALQKGTDGLVDLTDEVAELATCLAMQRVPEEWLQISWARNLSLGAWFAHLKQSFNHLNAWANQLKLPKAVWLPGLFLPNALRTAAIKVVARKRQVSAASLTTETHVTTMRTASEAIEYLEDGFLMHGLFLEGARWEFGVSQEEQPNTGRLTHVGAVECGGRLEDAKPHAEACAMPVMFVRVVSVKAEWGKEGEWYLQGDVNLFDCPVYASSERGDDTFVFAATLRTKKPVSRWVLKGVAMVMNHV